MNNDIYKEENFVEVATQPIVNAFISESRIKAVVVTGGNIADADKDVPILVERTSMIDDQHVHDLSAVFSASTFVVVVCFTYGS